MVDLYRIFHEGSMTWFPWYGIRSEFKILEPTYVLHNHTLPILLGNGAPFINMKMIKYICYSLYYIQI